MLCDLMLHVDVGTLSASCLVSHAFVQAQIVTTIPPHSPSSKPCRLEARLDAWLGFIFFSAIYKGVLCSSIWRSKS
jgi:hypothetical protein